jgi:hypothetical protein
VHVPLCIYVQTYACTFYCLDSVNRYLRASTTHFTAGGAQPDPRAAPRNAAARSRRTDAISKLGAAHRILNTSTRERQRGGGFCPRNAQIARARCRISRLISRALIGRFSCSPNTSSATCKMLFSWADPEKRRVFVLQLCSENYSHCKSILLVCDEDQEAIKW